jgi:V8-like Glu-specific endopeptidase
MVMELPLFGCVAATPRGGRILRSLTGMVGWIAMAALPASTLAAVTEGGEHLPIAIDTPVHYGGVAGRAEETTWHYTLSHPGSTYLAVHFVDFDLAPGDYLIVSGADGSQSYTLEGRGKMGAGTFWARHIKGDTLELELVQSSTTGGRGFRIDEYVAGFADLNPPDTRANCGTDDKKNAKCYQTTNPTEYARGRAVARLLINGSTLCTGWLVSPQGHLLTNEHCITSSSAALNTDYEFMAEAPTCATTNCQLCFPGTVYDGATFLKDDAGYDYCLVKVNGNPAAVHGYLEIDNRVAVVGEQIYIVQHPNGDAKEFGYNSTHANDTGGVCRVASLTQPPCSGSGYNDVGYYCDTEGGSSGSPVLASSTQKVIALHHCADCPNRAIPIRLIYPQIESFLLPPPAGAVAFDQSQYACSDALVIEVRDGSLVGAGSQNVTVTTTTGDSETLTLLETGAQTAIFVGSIGLSEAAAQPADGVVQGEEGAVITVSYVDANDGAGGTNLPRTDTALVDCTAPEIQSVSALNLQAHSATVRVATNESVKAAVAYGLACNAPSGTAQTTALASPSDVPLTGLADATAYYYTVTVTDEAGNVATSDNNGACYAFITPEIEDFFTELFATGTNDLDFKQITFSPQGGVDYYAACTQTIAALPTDPAGGTALPMSVSDTFVTVTLPVGVTVPFYGANYDKFFVGANGYITFVSGDTDASETYADHFNRVRIAPLFDDLNPSAGGSVSWKLTGDRVAVTWLNVPEATNTGANTFQVEMFFDGTVTMSYLAISANDGLAGLSRGTGLSANFVANDMSALGICGPRAPRAVPSTASTYHNVPVTIPLVAVDDGLPDPPGALAYQITSLPTGALRDAATNWVITAGDLPYKLANGGHDVVYQAGWGHVGGDNFKFTADDGGTAPEGGVSNEGLVVVTIAPAPPVAIHSWNLDSDPGWARDSQWAFGVPTGGGTRNHDPSSGHSGNNVFGYNLFGDYTISLTPRYLTTPVLDCSQLSVVSLRFWRWLGVEAFDQAAIEVSVDGSSWSILWVNPAGSGQSIADTVWTPVTYPVSAADGKASVRFRWRMGPTDTFTNYPGWNLDDIELWAIPPLNHGDYDADGRIDLDDYAHADECFLGPGQPAPVGCEGFDFDADGDADLQDFSMLQAVMTP